MNSRRIRSAIIFTIGVVGGHLLGSFVMGCAAEQKAGADARAEASEVAPSTK
ncbi:MAG: hypothetical protein U0169_22440 [Polyangiaceae bacterium]